MCFSTSLAEAKPVRGKVWKPLEGSPFKVWAEAEIRASPRRGDAADVLGGG